MNAHPRLYLRTETPRSNFKMGSLSSTGVLILRVHIYDFKSKSRMSKPNLLHLIVTDVNVETQYTLNSNYFTAE